MIFKNGKKEYMVDCDSNCNVVLRVKTDRKKMVKIEGVVVESDEYIYDTLGYFNSVEQCFNWFLNYSVKQKDRENLIKDLKSVVAAINEAKEEIKESLKNIAI